MKKSQKAFVNDKFLEELLQLHERLDEAEKKIQTLENETSDDDLTIQEKSQIIAVIEKKDSLVPFIKNNTYFKLQKVWSSVFVYRNLLDEVEKIQYFIRDTLKKTFDFKRFGKKDCHHVFVLLDNHLKCVCCGHSSLENDLSSDEEKWLIQAAKEKFLVVSHATLDDIPFLKRMTMEQDVNQGDLLYAFKLLKARRYDAMDPEYLNEETTYNSMFDSCDLMWENEHLADRIEHESSAQFKDLLLQECQVAQYEIRILNGESIPGLFEETVNESEKFAVAKAYYNLSREYFRKNSTYFKNEEDALNYTCLTAHPEINEMILERTISRKK